MGASAEHRSHCPYRVYLAAAGIALSAFTASGALSISSELVKWNEDLKGRVDHAADALLACGRFVGQLGSTHS